MTALFKRRYPSGDSHHRACAAAFPRAARLKSPVGRPLPTSMQMPSHSAFIESSNCDFVHGLLEARLSSGEFVVPLLPEVAVRVVRMRDSMNAQQLADTINADPAL